MTVFFTLINGLSFGIEYIGADDTDIDYPTVVIDFACFRWVIELDT